MAIDAEIRPACADDVGELARLLTPLGYPLAAADVRAVWSAFEAEGNSALVVPRGERLVGLITLHRMTALHRPRPVGRITSLFVDPDARGQGLGRQLVRAAERTLAEAGCGLIEVTSHRRRDDAHRFYEHLGYAETSLRFARELNPQG